ncbi:hypothetical protein BDQ12DRAFT_682840 [Crucibulum laeve]|uniref:Uncharacterized protein n=1 Tax=Crucibulum laeve TaxID=68775 RepID=A0A5C3MCW6_9AGAR|nr:hypothetical protein BDQ12DRAFT_682840 [Crucibulum laeve]
MCRDGDFVQSDNLLQVGNSPCSIASSRCHHLDMRRNRFGGCDGFECDEGSRRGERRGRRCELGSPVFFFFFFFFLSFSAFWAEDFSSLLGKREL